MHLREYASQADYANWVSSVAEERAADVGESLRRAFGQHITTRSTEYIQFERLPAEELAQAILDYPLVLKPLLVAANVAARAIERDLGVKGIDTYRPRLTQPQALSIAGYLSAFLPPTIALPALVALDRSMFVDKEIRKMKGAWESEVVKAINSLSTLSFRKARFSHDGQTYELDAAARKEDATISHGVDVKRVEARRDVHKRIDEISGKANHFKAEFPSGRFGVVIYYPLMDHDFVANRLRSPSIDSIVFAGASSESIEHGVRRLLTEMECLRK